MNANVEHTRSYYASLGPHDLCDCEDCKRYYARIKGAYPEVADYLSRLGADVERPLEAVTLLPDGYGHVPYCSCLYPVCGSCPDDYHHQIGDVKIHLTSCHPDPGIDEDYFVLDLSGIVLNV